ncbi:GntR family transcriptional regulator [Microbacterium gilvum]|uniref:HTH gntR-type domain-containing protein n=1 Tax=Microbacterium gilvum TaxID=1336204 RepID=A0ABP9AFP9_9MICO
MTGDSEALRRGILAIARETVRAGAALPGEHELARRLGGNRAQVRRVLGALEQQGIVRRHQGAATTVDPVALRMTVRLEEQVEHSELLDRLGFRPEVRLLDSTTGELGAELADVLSEPADAPILRARKLWTADGRPAMLAENTIVLPEPCELDAAASAFDLVADAWSQPIVWEVATPGVENAAGRVASDLGLAEGTACMVLTIVGMLRSGRRVFHAVERHHPDIVQYSVVRRFPEPWS